MITSYATSLVFSLNIIAAAAVIVTILVTAILIVMITGNDYNANNEMMK